MNCNDARRHWNLYHDSEGDSELYMQINEHLGLCHSCAEWFHQQSRLEEELSRKLTVEAADEEIWQGILNRNRLKKPSPVRRWLLFGSMMALAASLLLAFVIGWPAGSASDLTRLTADWHGQLVGGKQAVEFVSDSDLAVEGYLRQRVDFPVRCPPRQDAGFLVEGAGVCELGGSEAAYLVGEVEGRSVSIFIMRRGDLGRFPQQQAAVRRAGTHVCREGGYQMVLGEIDQNVVLVIGRTDAPRLRRVLNAYGTYHHGHHT